MTHAKRILKKQKAAFLFHASKKQHQIMALSEDQKSPRIEEDGHGTINLEFSGISSNCRVSGFALSGEVLVVSGDEDIKQEVLDVLSQNENTSPQESAQKLSVVKYNGVIYNHDKPQVSFTYVEPTHAATCLYDHMTVEESLHFADAVRTPMWNSSPSLLPDIVVCLKLQPILASHIGSLTPAQRYVVLLAVEAVTKKSVFFLKDPVAGLSLSLADSDVVMHAIRAIAHTLRRLVVVTLSHYCKAMIHPRRCIDRLLLVSSSGVVYFGRAEEASKLFGNHTHTPHVDLGNSFSDILFDLLLQKQLSHDDTKSEEDVHHDRCIESNYALRTLPLEREESMSPFSSLPNVKSTQLLSSGRTLSFSRRVQFYMRICRWLFWRAWVVRARNRSQIISQLVYAGIAPGAALSITFSHLDNDLSGFQGMCAFFTVSAYGIAILQNTCYHHDIQDWGVYLFERSRLWGSPPLLLSSSDHPSSEMCCVSGLLDGCSYLTISPLVTVVADMITLRILPPVVACLMVYIFVNLNDSLSAKITFFGTVLLLSMVGVLLCRCIAVLTLASFKTSEVQARSSVVSTSIFCFFVLYAGFLISPADIPESKYFLRNWSIYYWGCNNLYYSQLGDIYYATTQQTNEPRFETVFNHTQYVKDIPLVCNTLEPWCDYCNTSEYDHPLTPHPNYTCSFTTVVDLCTFGHGVLENTSSCVNQGINSSTATVTNTEVALGRNLLSSLAIEEIGERKVYGVLCRQAGAYAAIYVILCLLLSRKENHRIFSSTAGHKKSSDV